MKAANVTDYRALAYRYDGLGRLDRRQLNTDAPTDYLYDGQSLIAEHPAGANPQTKRYVHGAGVDSPLVEYTRQGDGAYARSWYAADYKGSIVATTDDAGITLAIYSYGDFGEPNTLGGAAFRYTGQRLDPDSGLYYYKARWYSANLGRFLSTDPIGTSDQINLNAYVANDPVNLSDPSGLHICTGSKSDCANVDAGVGTAWSAWAGMDIDSSESAELFSELLYLGNENESNGVNIIATSLSPFTLGQAGVGGYIWIDVGQISDRGANQWYIANNLGVDTGYIQNGLIAGTLAHEVSHEFDFMVQSQSNDYFSEYQSEYNAYGIEQSVHKSLGLTTRLYSPADSRSQNDASVATGAWRSTSDWICRSIGLSGC